MKVGTVISNPGPTTVGFSFIVNGNVSKNQFVFLPDDGVVGMVSEIVKENRYLESPETVHHFQASNVDIRNRFPVGGWEYAVARVKTVGVWKGGVLERCGFAPSPGQDVELVREEDLNKILGFDDSGLNLGKLDNHDVDVKVNLTRLLQKHLAILAMSGAGKSYATSVLIEELLDRREDLGKIGVVLIDVHGEYLGFSERSKEQDYSTKTKVFSHIKIGVPDLSAGMISELVPGMSSVQRRELAKTLEGIDRTSGGFSIDDVIKGVENSDMGANVKNALIGWLYDLASTGLLSDHSEPSINDMVRQGKLSIIDLSQIIDLRRKQLIVTWIMKRLFEERRKERIPPFLVIIEEAHNFAREGVPRNLSISKGIIETIAREGRKFGASLCLISQRPIQLSTTALSQCNTHLILRVTNPYDLEHIGKSSEAIDRDSLNTITSLRVGEGLLVGEAVNFPVFFKVRKRRSPELKLGKNLEEMAIEYKEKEMEEEKDALAFI